MNAKDLKAGGLCRVAVLGAVVVLAACAPMDPRKDADFAQKAHGVNQPLNRPVRSLSGFSDSLTCMDRMFYDGGVRPTLITSKIIPDSTGRVSVGTKEMIVTALSTTRGRRIEAAQRLGIGRNTITRKIQELGLDD